MLLSLDISTSCTGWAVFDDDELIEAGAIETKSAKFKDLFEKMDHVLSELEKLVFQKYLIKKIAAEEALLKFTGGKSTAKTIGMLTSFNFCLVYTLTRLYNCTYIYIGVRQARKASGIKIPKGEDPKKIVIDFVRSQYPKLEYPVKKTGNLKDWIADRDDAIIIGRACTKIK